MAHHSFKAAVFGCALALTGGGTALAQDAPPPGAAEPPRCGGLFCDLGLIGGKPDRTTLPCDDFFCRAFGGGRSAQAAPPPAPVAAEPVREETAKTRVRRTRTAKVATAKARTAKARTAKAHKAETAEAGPGKPEAEAK